MLYPQPWSETENMLSYAHMSHTVHTYTPDLLVQSLPPSVSMLVIEQPPPLDWETLEAKSPDQHWVPAPHTE